jgi:predicted transcriptional regulator
MDWKLYAWVNRGSRRKSVLELLANSEKPLSTNDIKKSLKIAISQASFTLSELMTKKVIGCVNPKDKIGKLYVISKQGRTIVKK